MLTEGLRAEFIMFHVTHAFTVTTFPISEATERVKLGLSHLLCSVVAPEPTALVASRPRLLAQRLWAHAKSEPVDVFDRGLD